MTFKMPLDPISIGEGESQKLQNMKLRLKVRRPTQESLILFRVETGINRSILSEPLFICAAS
jgi:hypothetical protein